MAQEVERKYLINKSLWANIKPERSDVIRQAYLLTDPNKTIRIRVKNNRGYLTIKGKTEETTKPEYEFEIAVNDANEIIDSLAGNVIEKVRHYIIYGGKTWEIDEFKGNNEGLIVAEIELQSKDEKFNVPDWVDKEVTEDTRYANSELSINPYKSWNDESKKNTHWQESVAFEVWKHHADIGGADKDRMIKITTWLFGLSAGIIAFSFKETGKPDNIVEYVAAFYLSVIGIIIAFLSAVVTLTYGGYANWNWAKADQIAKDYKWSRLDPKDLPFRQPQKPRLLAWALHQSVPKDSDKELAPVFKWFFWMALVSGGAHQSILIWSIVNVCHLIHGCPKA